MAKQLTIRGVSEEIGRSLKSLSRARGLSVNAIVLDILAAAVGVDERRRKLARHVTWNAEDLAEFSEALAAQRPVDNPLDREPTRSGLARARPASAPERGGEARPCRQGEKPEG
jgi:hypothetical protein